MSVKRYEPRIHIAGNGGMRSSMDKKEKGTYVLYTDYAAMQAKADRLAEAVEKWARVETGSGMWKDEAAAKQQTMEALAAYRQGE